MRPDALDVARRLRLAPRRLLIVDFDGTLAPFDPDPSRVAVLPKAREALESLAGCPVTTVAVVSGRPLADLAGKLPHGVFAVGSHGREAPGWDDGGEHFPMADVRAWAESVLGGHPVAWQVKPQGLAANLRALAPKERAEVSALLAVDCPVRGVRTLRGREIVEWVARDGLHKGDAALRLKESAGATDDGILVIGDDTTDEDMFRALPNTFTIHVGDGDSRARYRLSDPPDVARFLAEVSDALLLSSPRRQG